MKKPIFQIFFKDDHGPNEPYMTGIFNLNFEGRSSEEIAKIVRDLLTVLDTSKTQLTYIMQPQFNANPKVERALKDDTLVDIIKLLYPEDSPEEKARIANKLDNMTKEENRQMYHDIKRAIQSIVKGG